MKNTQNHKLIIRSITSLDKDEYEVAEVAFINGYNGKGYTFSLWCDDDFSTDSVEEFSCFVWLNSPVALSSLNYMDKESLESTFDDAMFNLPLNDLLKDPTEVRKKIKAYIEDEIPFEMEIPYQNQGFSLQSILLDEVVVEMTKKAFHGTLTRDDVMEMALLMDDEEWIGHQQHLIHPILAVIQEPVPFNSDEYALVQSVTAAFGLDAIQINVI